MANRTASELRDMVEEIEQPFTAAPSDAGDLAFSVRERMQVLDNILYTRRDYRKDISPLLANRINVGAAALRYWRNRMVADMRNELRIHLEPVGGLHRHETAADRMEVFESHAMLKLQGTGDIREDIHAYQALGFFWSGWLEMESYKQPDQAEGESNKDYVERCERHKKGFFPFSIKAKHPESVAFTENNRTLTAAVCRYMLPVVDLLERYGEVSRQDTGKMLKVYDKEFAWLRADEPGKAYTSLDSFRKEIEIIVVADGDTITHFVDLGEKRGRTNAARYRKLGEGDFPNPFGQVPLLLCEGVYNPGQPIAYRRESLMHSLANIEDAKAVLKSVWASKAASPAWWAELMPAEVNHDNPPPEMRLVVDDEGMQQIARTWARDVKELQATIDPNQDKLYGIFDEEAKTVSPAGLLNAESTTLGNAPSTTVLTQLDEAKSLLGSATRSETRMWSRVLDMIEHAYCNTLNSHRKQGEPKRESDWLYGFTTTGQERVKGRKIGYGEALEVKPQDFDIEYTRLIEPVDDRLSTQAALLGYWTQRRMSQLATYDDVLEGINIEDKEDFKERYIAEQLAQIDAPRIVNGAIKTYAAAEAVLQGRPFEEIMAEIAAEPLVGAAMASQGQAPQTGAVVRQGSGVTNGPGQADGSMQA